jgi:ubiquinone/menaquinone biosynthesis C-methylase UbiE
MEFQSPVEEHYYRKDLYSVILTQLKELGITAVTRKDIAGVDEFHIRGAAVSAELAKEAGFTANTSVLDVGCGLGGPCRLLADEYGCNVTGIDITEAFIRAAIQLTELVHLEQKAKFLQADALQLPFEDNYFDAAWTQHVQMNIEDKERFYSEIYRVLKPGGRFIYYDIFSKNGEPIHFPVPWADDASISFLISPVQLEQLLTPLGFKKIQTKDQIAAGMQFFTELFDKMSKGETPAISLPLIIGATTKEKFQTLYRNFKEDKLVLQSGMYVKEG